MTAREEAHRLLDEVPEDHLTDAVDMLRHPLPADVNMYGGVARKPAR